MQSKKRRTVKKNVNKPRTSAPLLFCKQNYYWLLGGLAVILLGYLLMAGGGSKDPAVFNPAIFSFRRIRLAPLLILTGFGIEIYAILKPSCE